MQLLGSNSISIPFFSPRECLVADMQIGMVAVVFTQICHPPLQLFASLFVTFNISSFSFRAKPFRTPSLLPVTAQIIPSSHLGWREHCCDVQGLSSALNQVQMKSCPWLKPPGCINAEAVRLETLVSAHCPCCTTCQAADKQHR